MSTNTEMNKYTVEFSLTMEVDAEDAVEAVEKARASASLSDAYIYVDGNMY